MQDQIKKLQEQNKQLDGVIEKQKAELRKMENRVSKSQESEASKAALEKKHEVLLQSNVWLWCLHVTYNLLLVITEIYCPDMNKQYIYKQQS